jgi:acetoacetyl-CoA reductase
MNVPRVALVTGGMGGLGEAICIKLAALGYKVVTTHSPGNARAQDWLDSMNKMGYGFRAYACDVADWIRASRVRRRSRSVGRSTSSSTMPASPATRRSRKWTARLGRRDAHELDSCFNMTKQVCDGMVDRGWDGSSTSRR